MIRKPVKKITKKSTKNKKARNPHDSKSLALPSDPKVAFEIGKLFGIKMALDDYCNLSTIKRSKIKEDVERSISEYMSSLEKMFYR